MAINATMESVFSVFALIERGAHRSRPVTATRKQTVLPYRENGAHTLEAAAAVLLRALYAHPHICQRA